MKEQLEQDIKKVLEKWVTQDNRGTRWPYYVTVVDNKPIYYPDASGIYYFDHNDAEIVSIYDKLIELYEQNDLDENDWEQLYINNVEEYDQIYTDTFKHDTGNITDVVTVLENHGIDTSCRYEQDYQRIEDGVFLTIEDCQNYIDKSRHHYYDPHTYITCFTKFGRTSETEKLFENLFEYFDIDIPKNIR